MFIRFPMKAIKDHNDAKGYNGGTVRECMDDCVSLVSIATNRVRLVITEAT